VETMLIELQKSLSSRGILISFAGRFSQGIIEELGEAIKKHMEAEDRPRNDIYNVFAIFVETSHNIKNYSASKQQTPHYEPISNSGIITIGKNNGGYFISTGNLIEHEDIPMLTAALDELKVLDKDQLKKRYKEQMKKAVSPESVGAGLGLIELARKSSQPLDYSIRNIDDSFSFFTLTAVV
jgi:hypothetical protein